MEDKTAEPSFGAMAPTRLQNVLLEAAKRSKLKRGAFRPIMSRLLHSVRSGAIDVDFQGANFRFYHRDNGTECGALLNPAYNSEELDFLRQQVPAGGVFVDVGANIGLYTAVLAKHVGPTGKVIAIEPHPTALHRLLFNCKASRLANVEIIAAAAAAERCELTIATDAENLGGSQVAKDGNGVRVIGKPLLEIVGGLSKIDGLKIDVEGYEDRVLTGFFRTAPSELRPRSVVIEHLSRSEWKFDCIENMTTRGYVIVGTTRSNTMLTMRSRYGD